MFLDDLELVLRNVPFNVWEKVVDGPVDKVKVERRSPRYGYSCQRDRITVYIHSGIKNYNLEGFDSLDEREETLLRCWQPYRELIEKEIKAYSDLLREPAEYMEAKLTELEFDYRLDQFQSEKNGMMGYYVRCFRLNAYLKKQCFGKMTGAEKLNEMFQREALSCIVSLVEAQMNQEDVTAVFQKYGVDISKEMIAELKGLADYCKAALEYDQEELIRGCLRRFLLQRLSIKRLYDDAEEIVKEAHSRCSEQEKEYSLALGIGDEIRGMVVFHIDNTLLNGWVCSGRNFYAQGTQKGLFYTTCDVMYRIWHELGEEKARNYVFRGKKQDPVLEMLLHRVAETVEEFWREDNKPLEKAEIIRSETPMSGNQIYYEIKVPEYDIVYSGFDKDEVEEKLTRLDFDRSVWLIRKCLEL